MMLRPHAVVHMVELPDPPPVVERATAAVAAAEDSRAAPQQPPGSGSDGAAALALGRVPATAAAAAAEGGQVVAEALQLLQPAASLHAAAVSSIQVRLPGRRGFPSAGGATGDSRALRARCLHLPSSSRTPAFALDACVSPPGPQLHTLAVLPACMSPPVPQPRVSTLNEWVLAQERRLSADPDAAEVAEKQLLARAHDVLAR